MRAYLEFVSGALALGGALVATLLLLFAAFPALPIGGEMLDVKTRYSHEEAIATMEGYGEQGRKVYAWSAGTLDTLLPLVYASFLAGVIYRFRPAQRHWWLACLPLLAGALDLGENVQIILMLAGYPDVSAEQVASSSLFTTLKSYALLLSLALAVVLAIAAAVRRGRRGSVLAR